MLKPLLNATDEELESPKIRKDMFLNEKLKVVGSQKKMNASALAIGLQQRSMRKRIIAEKYSSTIFDEE